MAIGEIVISAIIQGLVEKLTSLGLDYVQRKVAPPFSRVSTDMLTDWKKKLEKIYAVLDDADDKQLSGKGPVKLWLDDVRDLAFDMEDLLDEFEIEAAQAESESESSASKGQMKLYFFSQHKSYRSNPNPCSFVSETEIKKINDRLDDIVQSKASLCLTENAMGRTNYSYKMPESTCLPETRFLGRKKEETEILKLLTGEATNSDAAPSIVTIFGMGGVGKTALAQQLYNDATVSSCFEKRAWVCVSDIFSAFDITMSILRTITGSSYEGKDLNGLQLKLKDSLLGKKFLVVLDDTWNEDYEEWTNFLKPFAAGAKGSKIVVTTRNSDVVSKIGALLCPLNGLSDDDCTSLLASHALQTTNFERYPHLEKLGKNIAEKCKGLPLAAKLLGGALHNKRNPVEWEDILNSKIWDLPIGEKVVPVLKLSYVHLPPHLKRCFAYCAVFPKDYEIERDELVMLWTAEGFLGGQKEKVDNLKLGRNYFDELVKRSFLQRSSVDASKFSMHDLLNDLAKSIEGGTCFSSGDSWLVANEDHTSFEKIRFASFISSGFVTSQCLRAHHRMKALRSLMLLSIRTGGSLSISHKVLNDLLIKLKRLRVLSLCQSSITRVPKCVGDLKHIRYLNFSYTNIESLPESIVGLCKLQALILRGCEYLSTLPQGITKLVSLQFLDIRNTKSLKEMPLGISNLENLTILSKFVVGPNKGLRLKELKSLPHLQGELFISELQRVEEVSDAVDANLFEKKALRNLILHWDEDRGNLHKDGCESQVLKFLRPHTNLESLTISNYGGARFPSWLDGGSYSKILSLCLRGCPNVTSLSSLGQLPSLKELSLEGLHAVRMIGFEFYGGKRPFPSLTTLKFKEMLAWKDWSPYVGDPEEGVPFSYLQHLVVQECPSLAGTLPCRLEHLVKLEIRSCPHLNISNGAACLPSLCELYLEDCNKEILRSLVNPASLTILKISNIAELVCFNPGLISCLVKLKELHIEWCDELRYLWQDGNEMLNLTCLQELFIKGCSQFTSFVVGGGAIELPRNLETMKLRECTSLEMLPSKMHTLKYVSIWNCPKLKEAVISRDDFNGNNATSQLECSRTSFPRAEGRPTALKTIDIEECNGLESLEEIVVESLKSLSINICENLKNLPKCLHTLSHLTMLEIYNCPALEIEDFPPLPISLSNLVLWECPKIKSLPNQWHHLTSLWRISISNCPNIKCFPKGGWPPNLRELTIWGCENVKQPVREWGLPFLTSLQYLGIDGSSMGGEGDKVSFPSDADAWTLLFPSSLANLWIKDMRKVERLSSGLCNHLSSLQMLWISDCPKLRDLPEDGLPPSLQELYIFRCEKIPKDRYSKLAEEIPLIKVDLVQIR